MVSQADIIYKLAERLALEAMQDANLIPAYNHVTKTAMKLEGSQGWKGRKTMTQVEKIIKHILITGSITQREAILEYGTQSFHRRIADVREAGFPLINKQKTNPVTQAPYTRYEFENKATHTKAAKMFPLAKALPWN